MAALSRIDTDLGPLAIYLMLNEVDSRRASDKRLAPETVLLLASKFSQNERLVPGVFRIS